MSDNKKIQSAADPANKKEEEKKDSVLPEEELSEEDQMLKEKLELLVERLADADRAQRDNAITQLGQEIRGSTQTMTSVPKPLKFLSPLYPNMVAAYEAEKDAALKVRSADLCSMVGTVASDDEATDALKYCLLGSRTDLVGWGHEYLRSLSGQIGKEYELKVENGESTDQLIGLVDQIIPEFIYHNEEPEAVDLLIEVERLPKVVEFTNVNNYARVCNYLLSCSDYAADTEEMQATFRTAHDVFRKFKKYPDALRVAQKMNNMDLINEIMGECKDMTTLKQMAFMLARQRNPYESENEELQEIISNKNLFEHFKSLARDLDVMEPKTPESIYKSHLEKRSRYGDGDIDSAKKNLAKTYVNAFLNAGYGKDLQILEKNTSEDWIFKTKDDGQTAAAASLGLLLLWDMDEGGAQIDKYMERKEDNIVAGSFMALGLVNSGITAETDHVQALLLDKLNEDVSTQLKIAALMGLSFTYAGSARADLSEVISPIILDENNSIQLQAVATLAIGLIYVGTGDQDLLETIFTVLMEKDEAALDDPFMKLFALGLGLLFLGMQADAEASMEMCKCIPNPQTASFCELVIETCAYAGSGNVLKVQKMLHKCAEHKNDEKESIHQKAAVLGVSLIAFGEETGTDMCLRMMSHLYQYGDPVVKRTVPLAIGLLRVSNPEVGAMDWLTKLAYEQDEETAMSAIFSLGLIGAGTNNSKLAQNLRLLASHYNTKNSQDQLFVVRIAQGLVHMGKGLLGLNPLHSDKFLFSNVSLAGLLTVLMTCTDMKTFICGKYHYFLYYLTLSIYPRMLVTLNEELEPVQASVRVGQAVDTVGQAGKPKRITGFQTHDTPVLIGCSERAELATEQYIPESTVMENFVIVRPNPDYNPEEDFKKK